MFTLRQLAELTDGVVRGDPNTPVSGYCSLERPRAGCISYMERAKEAIKLEGAELAAIVTTEELAHAHTNVIISPHPKLAFIDIIEHFQDEGRSVPTGHIHAHAVVDPEAVVDESAIVGACAVIEAGAKVGARTVIGAGAFIGAGTTVGTDCEICAHAVVHHGCILGDRVQINSGTVVGSPGFGFVPTLEGHRRFPQVGRVVIEDDVEIGANCCIDRASLDDTVIHRGTKLDNLVQVAHGVGIGENTVIAAQVGLSGGTQIGQWCVIGGQAGFQGHISVGDQSIVGARSAVFSDLPAKSKVSGYPAKPHQQSLKVLALTHRLPELVDKIRSLEIELTMMRGELDVLRGHEDMPPKGEA